MTIAGRGEDDEPTDVDARLNALLDAYGSFLRSAVRKLCPSSLGVTVEELEQDARIRLWQALKRERKLDDPASYLYRIAATAAIDAVRRVRARRETQMDPAPAAGAEPAIDLPSPDRSPEALAADQQITEQVAAALAQLLENRRRAVGLHLRGYTSAEIARLLGWSEPKARNLTHRGLKDLRKLLT